MAYEYIHNISEKMAENMQKHDFLEPCFAFNSGKEIISSYSVTSSSLVSSTGTSSIISTSLTACGS
ncbi:hypothetical protein ACXWOG_10845, partial [Streptococcus pyogenes]